MNRVLKLLSFIFILFISSNVFAQNEQLRLNWNDNATNEDGTEVERRLGTTGNFVPLFTIVGANIITYTDNNLLQATDYCYRVRAYNAGGQSAYSNIACAITPAILTVTKSGNGNGTVSSNPVGISCGTACTNRFTGKSSVTLTAVASAGNVFTGWSGACTGITATCIVSMTSAQNVTANFSAILAPDGAPSNLVTTPVLP